MKTSDKGIALIKEFEGFKGKAYLCPAGVPTIGYGFTKGVQLGQTMNRATAELRLKRELEEYEAGVLEACTREPNQHQFDAMVCFAFNVGVGGFKKSTVLKAHNRGDEQSAARAFGLWNKAGGKVLAGLTRRRAAEGALYLEPVPNEANEPVVEPMPQRVDEERPMTASTINRASVVAGGTAALASATEVVNTVSGFKSSLESLGQWIVPVLLAVTVAAAAYAVYQRVKQREEGWA